jgi:hypothetical protein
MTRKDILSAIDKADPTLRKSRLAAWMRANHDALDARLRGHRTVWSKLAAVFAEQGLVDSRGKPPTAEGARKTWQRVKAEIKRERAGQPAQKRLNASEPRPPSATSGKRRQPSIRKDREESGDDPLAAIKREMNERSGRKT